MSDHYQFAVFDYAHVVGNYQNPNPVPPMTQSGAMVDVYIASGVTSFHRPAGRQRRLLARLRL